MSLDEMRKQIHSKIQINDLPDAKEFIFPAARNPGFATGASIFSLIWTGIIALLVWKHAPFLFPFVFGVIDLLMARAASGWKSTGVKDRRRYRGDPTRDHCRFAALAASRRRGVAFGRLTIGRRMPSCPTTRQAANVDEARVSDARGAPITNRRQVDNLPHNKIVAACEETRML